LPKGVPSVVPAEAALTRKQEEAVLDAARKHMPPELWGRIEEKMVFAPLGRAVRHVVKTPRPVRHLLS
ncbi:MAG: hypothetical protein ACO3OO_08790, partial [Gemmobacter sp.]